MPGIDSASRLARFTFQTASADYFATMGTRIVRGRAFGDADVGDPPRAVVVSEAMGAALWPGQDALGHCLRIAWSGARPDTMPCYAAVGVAETRCTTRWRICRCGSTYVPEAQADFGT